MHAQGPDGRSGFRSVAMLAGGGPLGGMVPASDGPTASTVIAVAALAIAALVALTYVPGAVLRVWNERRLRTLSKGKLVLTYDDGPSPTSTRRILEVLDEFGARATFFVIGRRAAEHPEICDLVRERGHEIGSHSHTHRHAWYEPLRSIGDVARGCRAASRWSSDKPVFRPPCGKVSLWSWLAARSHGCRVVVWTLDTKDSGDAGLSLDEVEQRLRDDGGGVVLMHDLDWHGEPARVDRVIATTRRVLEVGRSLGLETCTISDLLAPRRRAG